MLNIISFLALCVFLLTISQKHGQSFNMHCFFQGYQQVSL